MSRRMAIRGLGAVGGFGAGVDALADALSASRAVPGTAAVPAESQRFEQPVFRADTSRLDSYVDRKALRRLDHLTKMALLGACLALEDAGVSPDERRSTGVVVATGYGATGTTFAFLDTVMKDGDPLASPTLFSSSVHNAPAAYLSIILGAAGPSLTVSQFEMSVPSALLTAGLWLAEGRVDRVLFGGADEWCDVLGYCWLRYFGRAQGDAIFPLEFGRQTAIAGEGAAFLLLTPDDGELPKYGLIDGVLQGSLDGGTLNLPEGARLFIGADGHRACGTAYGRILPGGATVSAGSSCWGSLPTGPAFDLAAAALALRDGSAGPICVVKLGAAGEYGIITLRRR